MVTVILTIAILNLALGLAAAFFLEWLQCWQRGHASECEMADGLSAHAEQANLFDTAAGESDLPDLPAASAADMDIPQQWLELLESEGIPTRTVPEAVIWALSLKLNEYREALIFVEGRMRQADSAAADPAESLLLELDALNLDWIEQLQQAGHVLAAQLRSSSAGDTLAKAVEEELLDRATHLESICQAIEAIDVTGDLRTGGKRLLAQIYQLIDAVHDLRDQLQAFLVQMLPGGQLTHELDHKFQLDAQCGLPNQLGMEQLLDQWWQQDPQRERAFCVVGLEIDRFGKLNARLGTLLGDWILAAFGGLLQELLRDDHGFHRVARPLGATFYLLLGDTDPQHAICMAERMRQVIEAASFEYGEVRTEMTTSCAVVSVGPSDRGTDVLRRVKAGINEAKKAGRNRTYQDDGELQAIIDPIQYQVKGRLIQVKERI